VVTVGHERDHQGPRRRAFLPAGPFAILPLTGQRRAGMDREARRGGAGSSQLSKQEFHGELEQRFGAASRRVKALDRRARFRSAISSRARHRERLRDRRTPARDSPIAGQGLTMGLKDVAALAEVVVDAARLGMDSGQARRARALSALAAFDTMAMGLATNSLNLLFSNQSTLFARCAISALAWSIARRTEKPVHPPGRGARPARCRGC